MVSDGDTGLTAAAVDEMRCTAVTVDCLQHTVDGGEEGVLQLAQEFFFGGESASAVVGRGQRMRPGGEASSSEVYLRISALQACLLSGGRHRRASRCACRSGAV